MMQFYQGVRAADVAVTEAVKLIKANHAGANLHEARKFLIKTGEALKAERFEEAVDLAKKAQLAAKPTTDYLLSRGRELASNAQDEFGSKSYEEAIEAWKKSLEEYSRARELAHERGEGEAVESIASVEETINENIVHAEIAIDNREMLRLVDTGNSSLDEANRLFGEEDFDGAKRMYEEAGKMFKEALVITEKRDFEPDREKIEAALESIEHSIEAVLLNKGEKMLKHAEDSFKANKFEDAEKEFSEALDFIGGLDIQKPEHDDMLTMGREGIIRAKLEQGKVKMQGADRLFQDEKYYEAKESYKASREQLETVVEEASRHKFSKLVDEINNLIRTCNQNIIASTNAFTEVGAVKPEIIAVDSVGKGAADFRREPIRSHVAATPAAQKLMEKYPELQYIGGGGFADVYRAVRKDGGIVAVKAPRNLDEKTDELFFRELNTWRQLKHRNIVSLIKPYLKPEPHFEIEYVDGENLDDHLKNGSFDIEGACRIIFDIARGLEYAHNKHIIHGDITPKNILLNRIGEAKITDFGLAKISTSSSELKGYTLPFAPVEMFEARVSNEKTDVYQLGLTFYLMLTGNNPFDADSRFVVEEKIKTYTPDPPGENNHRVVSLDDIIMRSLSKEPTKRPSLREFREQIYEFVKKNYGESLHLTENADKIIATNCNLAIFAAKQGDTGECLRALRATLGKVRDPAIREELNRLIEQVEFRINEEISMEPLLDKMETFLKQVEWEG
ncbi:MAG: Serine/threonine-protein kinase PknD [Candidatus Argoarchaeum ethanivorans]|uniref:Serine/threonine-protein kinase PknD n=1 Tax=Candidatus Argoarchaeum ethanivorans TaxID=2608793 RepID=A0A811T9N7_9EURY|nr:MAG: Serine/threonine-protein kinase PknD [Candidatus Argoarchaeum ethanivorans]